MQANSGSRPAKVEEKPVADHRERRFDSIGIDRDIRPPCPDCSGQFSQCRRISAADRIGKITVSEISVAQHRLQRWCGGGYREIRQNPLFGVRPYLVQMMKDRYQERDTAQPAKAMDQYFL